VAAGPLLCLADTSRGTVGPPGSAIRSLLGLADLLARLERLGEPVARPLGGRGGLGRRRRWHVLA